MRRYKLDRRGVQLSEDRKKFAAEAYCAASRTEGGRPTTGRHAQPVFPHSRAPSTPPSTRRLFFSSSENPTHRGSCKSRNGLRRFSGRRSPARRHATARPSEYGRWVSNYLSLVRPGRGSQPSLPSHPFCFAEDTNPFLRLNHHRHRGAHPRTEKRRLVRFIGSFEPPP